MKKNLYHVIFNLFTLSILIYIGVDIFYRTICFQLTEISSIEIAEIRTPNIAHYVPQPLNSFDVIVDRKSCGGRWSCGLVIKMRSSRWRCLN